LRDKAAPRDRLLPASRSDYAQYVVSQGL
jgi:hypothetical protein